MKTTTPSIVLVVLALLASCQSTEKMRLRATLGGGLSKFDVGGLDAFDGAQGSVRLEIAQQPEAIDNVEVGLRLLVGLHQFDDREDGITLDMDSYDIGGVAVVRPYFDLNDTVRLYAEGFGGYRHFRFDTRLSGGSSSISGNYSSAGLIFGAGLGAEIMVDPAIRNVDLRRKIIVGVEWSRSQPEDGLDIDDLSLLIGWSVKF